MYAPSLGELARAALEEGAAGLGRFSLRLLSPVAPMLASPAGDAEEALERLGEAAFEYKLDGARLQVHRAGDEVRVFTRQLQDVTARVPEVVEWARALPVREAVVEGEALALREDGRPRPFQETMRRLGRSKDVEAARRAMPLASFYFDALYLEGEGPLVSLPYSERVERLQAPRRAVVAPAAGRHPRCGRGGALLRAGPRGRARGPDGEVARRAVRRGPARLPLAEAEAGAHPRPRDPRRREGQRPEQDLN